LFLAGIENWGGVDTAPILERAWAASAGVGFTGKNTLQIFPGGTSYFFLAVLFLTIEVAPPAPLGDHCGKCNRCLTGCPTDAFPSPWTLDANRCISYWTIEASTMPPPHLRAKFGRWIFGCDICQEVCPHNHAPTDAEEDDFLPRHAWLDLDALVLSADSALLEKFIGTPLRRPGPAGLKRNALIALANIGDEDAVPTALHALNHANPLVRSAAVWCLGSLNAQSQIPDTDEDPLVSREIALQRSLRNS